MRDYLSKRVTLVVTVNIQLNRYILEFSLLLEIRIDSYNL